MKSAASNLQPATPAAVHLGSGRSAWLFSLPLLTAALAYLLVFLHGRWVLRDGDTYWHVTTGRWILENAVVPTRDPFSHTMRGADWTAFEWLSQLILALVHNIAGWTGLVALASLAFAVTVALLTRALLQWLEPVYALMFVMLAISMTADHVLARPHMLAMPFMMLWTIELVRAREGNRAPTLWLLPVMTVWANLHGGFTLGIAFAFAFALEALLAARRQQRSAAVLRAWGIFLVLAVGCALLTPHGTRGLALTWQVMFQDNYALSRIGEWKSPNFHTPQPLELWLLGGLALALHQGLRLPAVRLLLLLGLVHLSLKHVRNVELLGLLAPLFVASPLAAQWRQRHQHKPQAEGGDRLFRKLAQPAGHAAVSATLVAFLALPVWIARTNPFDMHESRAPRAALQAAHDAGLSTKRVLNAYQWGGYLIYSGVPPFIDGRSDMYRDAFIKQYVEAIELRSTDGLPQLLDKYEVAWTMLPPGVAAVALLDRLPGWRRVHTDKTAVVHARTTR